MEPDFGRMGDLIAHAGVDLLYSVKGFKRHAAVLPPGVEWRLHGERVEDIEADLLATVRPGDMLFLRGVLSARLSRLADALRALGGEGVEKIY